MSEKQLQLTRGEEEIMQILWSLETATVSEIIRETTEPRPAYTTVATFLKILENKGFVGHTPEGKSHRYHPLVPREEYARGGYAPAIYRTLRRGKAGYPDTSQHKQGS